MPATTENCTFRLACITHYGAPWTELPPKIDYIAFAQETCPTTQRIHYQTWAYASKAMRLTGWKKVFPGDHIEQMRGTLAENDAYCCKENAIIQFGLKPMDNGKKRSLKLLCEAVVEAANDQIPLCDVVTMPDNQATFVQYNNGISKLYDHAITAKLRKVDKNFAPEVIFISGPPGCGKTRYVFDKEPELYRVPASDKFKWKDGYCGQDAVLYDNVTPENITPNELLVEIDRYYVSLPKKGGFTGWRPKRIYFTSVFTLGLFSQTAKFSLAAEFTRRITSTILLPVAVGLEGVYAAEPL